MWNGSYFPNSSWSNICSEEYVLKLWPYSSEIFGAIIYLYAYPKVFFIAKLIDIYFQKFIGEATVEINLKILLKCHVENAKVNYSTKKYCFENTTIRSSVIRTEN